MLVFSLFWFYHGFIDLETNNMAGAAKIGLGILWLSPLKRKWTLHAVQTCIFAVFAFLDAGIYSLLLSVITAASGLISLRLPSARHTKRKRKK